MKRILLFLLVFLYLGSSSGFAMHFHYCMDELIETSLSQADLQDCQNCGMEQQESQDNGCCKQEFKLLKADRDGNAQQTTLQMMLILGVSLPPATFELPPYLQLEQSAADFPLVNSPPPAPSVPVYLRHCVFRI